MVIGEKVSTKWVKYDVDGEIIEFEVRYLSKSKQLELKEKATDKKLDLNKWRKLTIDWVIIDWKGLESKPGKPAECTLENKIKLGDSLPELIDFLIEAAKIDRTFEPDVDEYKKKFAMLFPTLLNGEQTNQS